MALKHENRGAIRREYSYEAELKLDGVIFHPDFTIRRVSDGKIIYWEHFGMADHGKYSIGMHKKIDTYIQNGIIPGINLIMTFETDKTSVDPRIINGLLKTYILN